MGVESRHQWSDLAILRGRDRVPLVWFQDTTGIDVGDYAEKAESVGLGQSLIYSIERSDLPILTVLPHKGTAAGRYIDGLGRGGESAK